MRFLIVIKIFLLFNLRYLPLAVWLDFKKASYILLNKAAIFSQEC